MRSYWIFNILITLLFIVSTTLFYRVGFNKTGFMFYLGATIFLVILSSINYKVNYKK